MKKILTIIVSAILFLGLIGICVGLILDSADTNVPSPSEQEPSSSEQEPPSSEESKNVDFTALTYCAFGDSITWGYDRLTSAQMENPYSKQVWKSLNLKSYRNAGANGLTFVSNVAGRGCIAETVISETKQYDIISVMCGVNDYTLSTSIGTLGDTTTSSIYGSLDVIATTLKENNPNAFIFFMTPYQSGHSGNCMDNNSAGYSLLDVANAVKAVANKYGIPVLDMFNDGKFEIYGMYAENSDKIHPNQDFVTRYTAPQIVDFIRANYDK